MKAHFPFPILMAAVLLILSAASPLAAADDAKAVDDYNFAAWLYNTGKYGLAVESYGEFLKNYPEHERRADALFGLAQALFHLERFQQAADRFEELRQAHPDFGQMPEALFQLGQSLVAREQYEKAEPVFETVRAKHAEHYLADWATARRAACLVSLDRPGEAAQLLAGFLQQYAPAGKKPERVKATRDMLKAMEEAGIEAGDAFLDLVRRSFFTLGLAQFNAERFDAAADTLRRYVEEYRASSQAAEARFRLAQALYHQEQFRPAAEAYEPLAKGDGEFAAAAAFERGLALHKAGALDDAAEAFADMARRFPDDARADKAVLYAGTFRYELEDYATAVERLRPLAGKDGDLADEASYWIGMSLLRMKKPAEARAAFETALQEHPDSDLAGAMRLGLADARLALGDDAAAADAFRAYAESAPDDDQAPRALYSACVALHRSERYDASDELCGRFLKRYGDDALQPQVLFLSGENRFLAEKYDAAADRYRELLAGEEGGGDRAPRAHFRLAWIHRYTERYGDALEALAAIDRKKADAAMLAEASYLEGVCLFYKQEDKAAIESFESYLKAPDTARFGDDALFKSAMARMRRDEHREAVGPLRRLQQDFPKSELAPYAAYQLAECHYELKEFERAAEQYRRVLEQGGPADLQPFALFGLGLSLYDRQSWAEAATAFGDMAERYPDSGLRPQAFYRRGRALMRLSKWSEAAEAFAALLKSKADRELTRSALVSAASCYQEQKQWEKAAQTYRDAIADYPAGDDQARLHYEMAWAWHEAGEEKKALDAFRRLAEEHRDDPLAADAFFHLAEANYKRDVEGEPVKDRNTRLTKAREQYEQVLELAEDDRLRDKALYRIGWCRWSCEEFEQAAAVFDRLLEECPKSDLRPDAYFQGALAHARAGNRARALTLLEDLTGNRAYAGLEYIPDALLALGEYRLAEGNPAGAIDVLDRYVKNHAQHHGRARAHLLRGKAHYRREDMEQALEDLETCTRLTRTDDAAQARFYIGQIHQGQSDFKKAVVAYLRVQALYPEADEWSAASLFELGKCYAALGRESEAKKTLQDLAKRYSGTKWAELARERLDE